MKKEMKEKINSLDPRVREKLIRRLAAEVVAKKNNLDINFDGINQNDYINTITIAQIGKENKLSEIQKKALLVKLANSKPPQKVIDKMNPKTFDKDQ